MLTVHHLRRSQSLRIVWLCEELGLGYDLVAYDRDPQTRSAPPEYRALHPFGTAPVIVDDTLVLAESGAIITYLIQRHGAGRLEVTAAAPEFPDYLFWFHFAAGSLVPAMMNQTVLAMFAPDNLEAQRTVAGRGDRAYAMIEERLGQVPYFAGDTFTAADIMMAYPLTTGRSLEELPHTRDYLGRLRERPAYRAAVDKAGEGQQRSTT